MASESESRTHGGITFDQRLTDEVQRRVLGEGICPNTAACAEALFSAYRGYATRKGLVDLAAVAVWNERASLLAAPLPNDAT